MPSWRVNRESVNPVDSPGTHRISSRPSAIDIAFLMRSTNPVSKGEELATAMKSRFSSVSGTPSIMPANCSFMYVSSWCGSERISQVRPIDPGTLLDFTPPCTIVGVTVIRDRALSTDARSGLSGSTPTRMSSILSGDGLCSMAKVDRCWNISRDVSRSGSYAPIRRISSARR